MNALWIKCRSVVSFRKCLYLNQNECIWQDACIYARWLLWKLTKLLLRSSEKRESEGAVEMEMLPKCLAIRLWVKLSAKFSFFRGSGKEEGEVGSEPSNIMGEVAKWNERRRSREKAKQRVWNEYWMDIEGLIVIRFVRDQEEGRGGRGGRGGKDKKKIGRPIRRTLPTIGEQWWVGE